MRPITLPPRYSIPHSPFQHIGDLQLRHVISVQQKIYTLHPRLATQFHGRSSVDSVSPLLYVSISRALLEAKSPQQNIPLGDLDVHNRIGPWNCYYVSFKLIARTQSPRVFFINCAIEKRQTTKNFLRNMASPRRHNTTVEKDDSFRLEERMRFFSFLSIIRS